VYCIMMMCGCDGYCLFVPVCAVGSMCIINDKEKCGRLMSTCRFRLDMRRIANRLPELGSPLTTLMWMHLKKNTIAVVATVFYIIHIIKRFSSTI